MTFDLWSYSQPVDTTMFHDRWYSNYVAFGDTEFDVLISY